MNKIIVVNGTPSVVLKSEFDFLYKIFYKNSIEIVYKFNQKFYFADMIPFGIISNIKCPIKLEILSKEKDWIVRDCVAKNLHTPKDVLITLYKDSHILVKVSIAENINTPEYILRDILEKEQFIIVKNAALETIKKLDCL